MALFLLTYDVRSTNHDYAGLYEALRQWKAEHVQNSVWLAELRGPASVIRDVLLSHMHPDDTVFILEVKEGSDWAMVHCRQGSDAWLRGHVHA